MIRVGIVLPIPFPVCRAVLQLVLLGADVYILFSIVFEPPLRDESFNWRE